MYSNDGFLTTLTWIRPVARCARGGAKARPSRGAKIAKWIFFSLPLAGGPNFEKVDKIYTRGEKFSKRRSFWLKYCNFVELGVSMAPPYHGPVINANWPWTTVLNFPCLDTPHTSSVLGSHSGTLRLRPHLSWDAVCHFIKKSQVLQVLSLN